MIELQWAHVKTEAPSILDARPDCPPVLAAAVMRMLAKDAKARWPSLQDVVPSFAAGLTPGDETPRRQLADMVRVVSPVPSSGIAVTPASPIPRSRGAASPAPPVAAHRTAAPPPVSVVSVPVGSPVLALEIGDVYQLTCSIRDDADNELSDRKVFWCSNASVGEFQNALAPSTTTSVLRGWGLPDVRTCSDCESSLEDLVSCRTETRCCKNDNTAI